MLSDSCRLLDCFDAPDTRNYRINRHALFTKCIGQVPVIVGRQAEVVGHFDVFEAVIERHGEPIQEFHHGVGFTGRLHPILHGVEFVL